jgi:hypothetical protein
LFANELKQRNIPVRSTCRRSFPRAAEALAEAQAEALHLCPHLQPFIYKYYGALHLFDRNAIKMLKILLYSSFFWPIYSVATFV